MAAQYRTPHVLLFIPRDEHAMVLVRHIGEARLDISLIHVGLDDPLGEIMKLRWRRALSGYTEARDAVRHGVATRRSTAVPLPGVASPEAACTGGYWIIHRLSGGSVLIPSASANPRLKCLGRLRNCTSACLAAREYVRHPSVAGSTTRVRSCRVTY